MKCTKGGQEKPEGSKYCNGCVQPFSQGFSAPKEAATVESDTSERSKQTRAEKYVARGKKKNRYTALICSAWGIVLIALLGLLISKYSPVSNGRSQSDKAASQSSADGWSLWVDELPADVTDERFQIETHKLYRSRSKETTSSSQDTMEGWELSGSATGDGSLGTWSEWSTDAVSASSEREVETQVRYRCRDKETTTSGSDSMNGWTQYDVSYSWGDYGVWSKWSTNYASSSNSCEAESKTQYRYRDISYTTAYTDWNSWSSWQDTAVSSDDQTEIQTRTVYGYYWYQCPNCGAHMHGWGFTCPTWAGGCGKAELKSEYWHTMWSTTPPGSVDFGDWYGTTHYYAYVDGVLVFRWDYGNPGPKTQYRYRTRSTYQEPSYSGWSNWGDTYYSSSSTREVESRTVYRCRNRSQLPTYHFYRWGAWSEWSSKEVSSSNDREVETTTFYRYRDKEYAPVYYFVRWSDWSEWSTNVITPSDSVEVEEKEQYRYRPE